jgi:MSHA biogenesis protein MshN
MGARLVVARARVRRFLQRWLDDAAMSLINKMLRELDKRHAPRDGFSVRATGQAAKLAQQVRPVASGRLISPPFWWATGGLALVAAAWMGWQLLQLSPNSVVTELALQSPRPSVPQKPALTPAVEPSKAQAPAPDSAQEQPRPERSRPAARRAVAKSPASVSGERAQLSARAGSKRTPKIAAAITEPPPVPVTAPPQVRDLATPDPGKIERRSNSTSRERADSEFRRAVNLVSQGRIAEGMEGLRGAMQIDPNYEDVRQTLVALLLEARRVDDAAEILQEGLALNPAHNGYAILLARIMVDRGDISGALELLRKHAPAAGGNAAYHAFAAALYQRLDRHQEAIEEYRAALKLSPSAGAWWVGLGISYQGSDSVAEAMEAFRRARTAGLSPELAGFVDRQLKQAQ